jgi:sulfate permease, SulP family
VSFLVPSLRGYPRSWLAADLLAGLTLAAICVPESMADARLAAMPPITGLYAFLAGALGAVLFSASRQLSVGPDSTIGPMMAVGVGSIVATSSPDYGSRIVLLALILGVAVLLAGVARLGFLADLLSRPVMSGFLSGVGLTVVVGQFHVILGLPASGGGTVEQLVAVVGHLGVANLPSLAIGLAVLAILLIGERFGPRFPGALIAVLGSLLAVAALGLGSHGVVLVGALPSGLPALLLPSFTLSDVTVLVPVIVPIFFVILAQTAATSRGFAVAGGYEADVDRDLLAVGTASALAGLTGTFAVNASPTRTGVVAASNGRSQLVNLIAGSVVAAVLLVATGALADLPEATLGGILIAVGAKLVKWRELSTVARYSRPEWAIALVTLLVVAVVGIEPGIYLAIGLALLRRVYLSARPHDAVLGRLPGSEGVWVSERRHPDAQAPAGVRVFRFDAPLFYANAEHFAVRIRSVIASAAATSGGEGAAGPEQAAGAPNGEGVAVAKAGAEGAAGVSVEDGRAAAAEPVRAVVVEAVGMDDLDYTGAQTLSELDDELRRRGVMLAFAHPFGRLGRELTIGSLAGRFRGRVFDSVDDAVKAVAGPADRSPSRTKDPPG